MGESGQWKAIRQRSQGDACSFSHDPASGNRRDQSQEGLSSSVALKGKAHTYGKIPSKSSGRRRAFQEQEERFPAEISTGESVRIRHVIFGTLPCVTITRLNSDAHLATNADSDTSRLMGSPAKSRGNVV